MLFSENQFPSAFRSAARSETVREVCSVLFIVVLASVMLFPVFRGDWPVGHDHPAHLFRIWQLKETILQQGTPWSWSHRWFAGYPQNLIYPVGTDFFVLTVHALSFGNLSIGQAYGVAFWLFYVLYGYAAFLFIRRALGSRVAGIIAVIFLLTDPGSNDIGGWFWIADVGVWTAALGMIPALIGTLAVVTLLDKPTPKTAAAIGLCFGLAMLCHPLHLIYVAIAIPVVCASRFVTGEETKWRPSLLLLGLALICGALIASFWLVPRLSGGSYIAEMGLSGSSLSEIGVKLATGQFFDRMHWLAMAFGVVGSLFLLRAKSTLPLFMGIFVFVCVVLSSSSFVGLFGQETANWLNRHVIFPRLLMLLKPFWYGAAAFVIVAAWTAAQHAFLARSPSGLARASRAYKLIARTAMVVFLCAFIAPILFHAIRLFIKDEVLRPTQWHSRREDLSARAAFVAWAKAQLPKESGFFRIAHGFDQDEHSFTDLGIEVPYPFYKIYVTPTGDHFKYALGSSSPEAFRATNVRYALSGHPLHRPDFHMITTFNDRLILYGVSGWNPNPFEVPQGAGEVKLQKFTAEEIVLKAEAGAHGLLRLNVSHFPRWHATLDGVSVPITPVPVEGVPNSRFMQVPLLPGTYQFRYIRDSGDYVGTFLCVLGATGYLILASWTPLELAYRRRSKARRAGSF